MQYSGSIAASPLEFQIFRHFHSTDSCTSPRAFIDLITHLTSSLFFPTQPAGIGRKGVWLHSLLASVPKPLRLLSDLVTKDARANLRMSCARALSRCICTG
eukprot:1159650-Pelagomonas_calceolata.AAC.6